jgi:hypothetical protein
MQNVPTSATSTKPSATIANVKIWDLQGGDNPEVEVTTDPAELEETTTELPAIDSKDEDEDGVTTAQYDDQQATEAVTDLSNIDETTTSTTMKIEVESDQPASFEQPDTDVETEQSRSSLDSMSSQLKKPLEGDVPEAEEVVEEEDDIKLEVKWEEKVSTLEGTSMLIRIHASQNVEKVSKLS